MSVVSHDSDMVSISRPESGRSSLIRSILLSKLLTLRCAALNPLRPFSSFRGRAHPVSSCGPSRPHLHYPCCVCVMCSMCLCIVLCVLFLGLVLSLFLCSVGFDELFHFNLRLIVVVLVCWTVRLMLNG